MISFRFYIVATVASFLFMALGIVVGTTALNGPITQDLRTQLNTVKDDRATLAERNKSLTEQVNQVNQFAGHFSSKMVNGALTNQSVLLIRLPGATADLEDALSTEINAAGGQVAGRLQITSDYVDPSRSNDLFSIANSAGRPYDIQLTPSTDAGKVAGQLLATVLVGKGLQTDLQQVLSSFSGLHMLNASSGIKPSTTIIVEASGSLPQGDARAQTEVDLVNALQQQGANLVVAGDSASATASGIVALVRANDKGSVSSVDNADTPIGVVTAVLATANVLQSKFGQYGTSSTADSLFP